MVVKRRIAHHVHQKAVRLCHGFEHGPFSGPGKPVLHGGDAVLQIDLLSRVQLIQELFQGRLRELGGKGRKSGFLQVAVWLHSAFHPADFATLRVGGMAGDAKGGESRGVDHAHMSGGVGNEYGRIRKSPVQHFLGGMGFLFEKVMVVPEAG